MRFVEGGRPFDFAQGRLSPADLFQTKKSAACAAPHLRFTLFSETGGTPVLHQINYDFFSTCRLFCTLKAPNT